MEKKIKQILWIVGIIIIGILLINNYQKQNEPISMKVHYYLNGKEVFPQLFFSIVTPPGENYDAISFTISGTNTGNINLTDIQIIDASPLAFKNALPTTTQNLLVGQPKTLWTSNIMNTSQFESMAQPVNFWVNISGLGISGWTAYSEEFIDLAITPKLKLVIETVEFTNDVGAYSSTALDSNGIVHISHFDNTNKDLRYCNNTGGSWSCVAVDANANDNLGGYSSIAIDSNNKIHISYINATTTIHSLRYCNNIGGSWSCTTIDSGKDYGDFSSIAIDSNNKIHISYFDDTNNDLRYCNNIGGSWSCATIDTTSDLCGTSIAIDSNNKIHISHSNCVNLRYCNNIGGSWSCEIIDSGSFSNFLGYMSSIAIDSNNKIHISHGNFSGGDLRYCNNTGGSWSCVDVDITLTASLTSIYSSIAIDSSNTPYISWYNATNFIFCTKKSGSWDCVNVESSKIIYVYGRGIAIKKGRLVDATSSDDFVHMSYYNSVNGDLMYAKTSP